MASRLTITTSFPRVFLNSCNFQGNVQAFRLRGLLQWQKLTWFFQHILQFEDFAVQFCFRCKFSFNEKRRLSQVWRWRDFCRPINSLLCIATNEIALFCINHRSRQMAFSRAKAGQGRGFHVMLKCFEIKRAFRYYIKQIDSMLPCVWFSNRSQDVKMW